MAAHVDRHGETGDVGRTRFNINRECSYPPAEPLRPDPGLVDPLKHPLFQFAVERVGIAGRGVPAESTFGEQGTTFKITADSHSDNNRRAGIAPRCLNRLHNII